MLKLPRVHLRAGQPYYRPAPEHWWNGGRFEITIVLFPLPEDQQEQGMMVKARFAARLMFQMPKFQWWYSRPMRGYLNSFDSRAWTGREVEGWRCVAGPKLDWWRWS